MRHCIIFIVCISIVEIRTVHIEFIKEIVVIFRIVDHFSPFMLPCLLSHCKDGDTIIFVCQSVVKVRNISLWNKLVLVRHCMLLCAFLLSFFNVLHSIISICRIF
ncbi:hypothetical protein WN66_04507 [Saccharomyces cerevisiae]|uniref:Vps65p n=1 Tax=Saccharomyces cerevisiae (strain Lalvin EC1118 / Prise de mousse) TaxID=643680 RepID=C8ZDT3_YEAS8|nr:hypothetical protein WN66_04507 [Saccharomyces cerevisiae]CAY81549.1 Vps65p [Saccharomyces cerevisiae EC1118]